MEQQRESWVTRARFPHPIIRTNSSKETLAAAADRPDLDASCLEQGLESIVCSSTSDFRYPSNIPIFEVGSETPAASPTFRQSGQEAVGRNTRNLSMTKPDDTPGARARRLLLETPINRDRLLEDATAQYYGRNLRVQRNREQTMSYSDFSNIATTNGGGFIRGLRSKSPTPSLGNLVDFREARSMKRSTTLLPRRGRSIEDHDREDYSSLRTTSPPRNLSLVRGHEKLNKRNASWSKVFDHSLAKVADMTISAEWTIDRSKLLIGHKFAAGAHSKLFYGKYDEKPVAIKFIRQPENATELAAQLEKQFNREVTLLSHLYHRNVIKLVGAYKDPPVFCIITEFLAGGSLRLFLHKLEHTPLPLPKLIAIALDIAHGMDYIHSQGVIHRDLKPENIIFDEESCAKIVDYGIACEEANHDPLEEDEGTYRWMAPEMIRHKQYGRKVDVYSFGLILWEMATGTTPYEDMTPIQAAFAVVDRNMRPEIPSDCPGVLRALMEQCWSSNPDKRPGFWEIVKILEHCESVLNRDGSLDSIPCNPEHHKNWFAHLMEKLKHGHPVSCDHLPPKLL